MAHALISKRIFTGEQWLDDHAILVEGDRIIDVVRSADVPRGTAVRHCEGFLAPAFIDLQIYGAHGRLLAVYPEAASLRLLMDYCRQGGAAFCLPTVATNEYGVFRQCIDAVRDYWKEGGKGVMGLHIEGPWISRKKRGAHIESLIHSPTLKQAKELLDYGRDVIKMVTLAPEECPNEVLELLKAGGIVISAGHSNAGYRLALEKFGHGITAVTHLFNAMSPLHHREPGLVGAAMNHPSVMASIIADGHHVDFAAISIAKAVMKDRLFAITDAVTETDRGHYPHTKAGDKYESSGILSGSALTMARAFTNLVEKAGIEPGEALRMCSLYPARVMGMDKELGMLRKDFRASIIEVRGDEVLLAE